MAAQTKLNITTDRSALLVLKARITSDPQNMIFINWSTTTPICNWVGVTCGARHHRVANLNLSYFGLTGTIPPELGNLSFLVNMDFSNNNFHGSIPATIFNLSALQKIDLSDNQLSEIPNEIGTLNHLEKLYVQDNALKGPIPMTIFNISSLTIVTFYGNNLNGIIPDNICQNLSNIQGLNLGANQFNGPLPSIFGQCKQLLRLDLEDNSLTGPIPYEIGYLPNLEEVGLSENNLNGHIPSSIVNISTIKGVDITVASPIPYEIGYLPNLEILALHQNNLNGHIPSSIFNISTITGLGLSFSQLLGSLPADIGLALPKLEKFYAGANHLSGVIPKSISNASELRSLDLGGLSLAAKSLGGLLCSYCPELNLKEWNNILKSDLWESSDKSINFFDRRKRLEMTTSNCYGWLKVSYNLKKKKEKRMLKEVGNDYFDDLLSSSFLQHRYGNDFIMHDLTNYLAKFVSGKFCVRLEDSASFQPRVEEALAFARSTSYGLHNIVYVEDALEVNIGEKKYLDGLSFFMKR
ncbi:LRR receptor-like serine/threonine-protein kinase FLS2 [Rosa chinensis]|uniref:LRR receptor-like serine/threonine-protein kinase FLS2 n=1 Tax=Rosa chinensis TaxID=74649 RepID=UPI001AD90AC4|nr:LRR receptor-like serine/threonine-protein kinase FLS2 [Rosa chinensis]